MGGGTNLFMATKLMEDIPLFVPKMIVSTMIVNSIHNFKPYKDILYIQSPCDFGLFNPLTKSILTNCVTILTSMGKGLPQTRQTLHCHHRLRYHRRMLRGGKEFLGQKRFSSRSFPFYRREYDGHGRTHPDGFF